MESKFHKDREKDKMRYQMGLNSSTETFIFMQNGSMIKVVIDFSKKTCVVYSSAERVLLRLEKMSTISMLMLKKQISDFIKDGKRLRGFRLPPGMGYL